MNLVIVNSVCTIISILTATTSYALLKMHRSYAAALRRDMNQLHDEAHSHAIEAKDNFERLSALATRQDFKNNGPKQCSHCKFTVARYFEKDGKIICANCDPKGFKQHG